MTAQVLELLTTYGLPALFAMMVIGAAGIPLPNSLMLILLGSLVSQGDMEFWPVIAVGTLGAVIGDQAGYAAGRFGGRPLLGAITRRIGGADKVDKAEAFSRKWAGIGVFLTRWLIGPLGPWINVTSGLSEYPWWRFLVADVAGEFLWLLIYVSVGRLFSDQVQAIADVLGNLTWVIVGLAAAGLLGWKLFKRTPATDEIDGRGTAQIAR